ncbi:Hypothetical predicted protein [Pelobates cultripes]|uniref:Uncharacterized protein n=1 Tax=Pelobates cultripes TaxID=61616 RepID=A0AAD1SZ64_PELCU|nr:Hypothetical predicted protein [Pelobates cultripes]
MLTVSSLLGPGVFPPLPSAFSLVRRTSHPGVSQGVGGCARGKGVRGGEVDTSGVVPGSGVCQIKRIGSSENQHNQGLKRKKEMIASLVEKKCQRMIMSLAGSSRGPFALSALWALSIVHRCSGISGS